MIAKLVCRARDGDAEAYTALVRRFQDAVFATAYHTVLDFDAARDIAQDTFVRAYESLGRLHDSACFPGWVVRICRNLAVSWLRRPERCPLRRLAAGSAGRPPRSQRSIELERAWFERGGKEALPFRCYSPDNRSPVSGLRSAETP